MLDFAEIRWQTARRHAVVRTRRIVLRIFMEGQEEWLEPGGEAMVILAKLLGAGAFLALGWAAFIRFAGHQALGQRTWPQGPSIAALVLAGLCVAFWLAGKLSIFAGRKMRERGIKLP